MTALQPYPAYKDSGVEWLGDVPEHWEVRRVATVADMRVSNVDKHIKEEEHPVRLCNYVDVYHNERISSDLPFMVGTAEPRELRRFRLAVADVLITKDSEDWTDIGVPALVEYAADNLVCGYHLAMLRPNVTSLDGGYLFQALRDSRVAWQFQVAAVGVTRYGLSQNAIKSTRIPLPPLAEQTAIARFLDHADRRIRRYIRAKETLIELLEEQKQAIIHQAVTGRIDVRTGRPYPAYKDSGVEWLGEVPEHWEVAAMRHLATKFGSGVTPRGGATAYVPRGVPLLRSQNVHFDGLRLEGVARIPVDLHLALNGTHVKPGDVLLNITGASIGRVCAVPDDVNDANVNQHVCIIRPRPERVLPDLLAAFLSTPGMQEAIELEQVGASRQGLTLGSIRSFKLFIPPLEEQSAIVRFLDHVGHRIKGQVGATKRQIDLLREYHKRLIADVVTGKLDVRDAAARLPEVDPMEDGGGVDATRPESKAPATEYGVASEAGV